MAEHSMYRPPSPPRRLPPGVLPFLCPFHNAKSRGSSLRSLGSCSSEGFSSRRRRYDPRGRRSPRIRRRGSRRHHPPDTRAHDDQLTDEADDLRNGLARLGLVVWSTEAEQVDVLHVPIRCVGGETSAVTWRGEVILSLMSVMFSTSVTRYPPCNSQRRSHRDDKGASVPDVNPLVDRRPAEVHADQAGWRRQLLLPAFRES